MCEWCTISLVATIISFSLELRLRGIIAMADNLIVVISLLLPLILTLSREPNLEWLGRCPNLCALSAACVFVDYVYGAEAIDWDEYDNEDALEMEVEANRVRHTMLVGSMVAQLVVMVGLMFVARSTVSLLRRLEIDWRLRQLQEQKAEARADKEQFSCIPLAEATAATCTWDKPMHAEVRAGPASPPPSPPPSTKPRASQESPRLDQSVRQLIVSPQRDRRWRFSLQLPCSTGRAYSGREHHELR